MDDFDRMLDEQWPGMRDKILKQYQEKGHVADMITIPKETWEALYERARGDYAVENYAQAEEQFQGLVLFKGDDIRGWLGYAGACEAQKKWEQAAMGYGVAMVLAPGDPVAAYRAGICLMNMGDMEKAVQILTLAAETRKDVQNDPLRLPYAERAQSMLDMLEKRKDA